LIHRIVFLCSFLLFSFGSLQVYAQSPTYFPNIEPIIRNNCTACHKKGGGAPFPLTKYEEVASKSRMIGLVVKENIMPPWKADTLFRKFHNQRVLSQQEKSLIEAWVKSGAKRGAGEDAPFIAHDSSMLGKPDLVIRMNEAFELIPNNRDTVVFFKIPFEIERDTNVLAFEFIPGNSRAVHHSNTWVFFDDYVFENLNFQVDTTNPAYFREAPKISSLLDDSLNDFLPPFFPEYGYVYYDGWVPGATPRKWPEGFGFVMPRKGFIVLQVHYAPTPIAMSDQSFVNIFFTDKPITRPLEIFNIGSSGGIAEPEPELILEPESIQKFEVRAKVAKNLSYVTLNPHMHYLGKEMKAFAIKPNGDTIPLIYIPEWDFNWQEFYVPEKLIFIPEKSEIVVQATFDNTSDNPSNPTNPPKRVISGANTTDEMMSLIVVSVPYLEGDEEISP